MPLISVLTTFFNESREVLKRSIDSIVNQEFTDFEFIVIAGNPENTEAITMMKEYSQKYDYIIFKHFDKKLGQAFCLNMGLDLAKGEYIAMHEADDISLPERFTIQVEGLKRFKGDFVLGSAILYLEEGTSKLLLERHYPEDATRFFNRFSAISHSTTITKKENFEKYGRWSESDLVRNTPDYELWLRWISQGVKIYNVKEVLYHAFQSKTNGRNKNAKKTLLSSINLKEKFKDKLNFSLGDKTFLLAEKILYLLPSPVISKLFYIYYRVMA